MDGDRPQRDSLNADEFLRWADGREERSEFVRGHVVRMPDGTRRHAELSAALATALHPVTGRMGLGIAAGWSVRTLAGIRSPDVTIFRRTGDGGEHAASEPVLARDDPLAWVWSRNAEGRFGRAEMIAGREEVVELPGLGTSLALAELHRGIA